MKRGRVPPRIADLVREGAVGFSAKAWRLLEQYAISDDDLEHCICHGYLDGHPRRDETGEALDGRKYVIGGPAVGGYPLYIAGKVIRDDDGLIFYIITVHGRED